MAIHIGIFKVDGRSGDLLLPRDGYVVTPVAILKGHFGNTTQNTNKVLLVPNCTSRRASDICGIFR